jgi:crotonobetainyl-CoA:carnitine CoA-transferase CaiB-like acyl-CoA transferase
MFVSTRTGKVLPCKGFQTHFSWIFLSILYNGGRGMNSEEQHATEQLARPLNGIRVLDISTMIAAPLAASLLADYGAEVVKVERPGTGDFVRKFGAQKGTEGLYWKTLSRNKKSVALDFHHPEAQNLIKEWLPKFDVLIENFRPGTLERWGLSPEELLKVAPHLVILRVTAFGQTGPYKNRPGFGTLAEAMSGIAPVSGFEDKPPLLPAFPLADIMSGYLGASSTLAAVIRAQKTKKGEVIDLAIYEAIMKLVELQIIEFDQNGTLHRRMGNQFGDAAPRGAYQCKDDLWIAMSASTQPVAERVLRAVGGEELLNDPRFKTNATRLLHADELDEYISNFCRQYPRDEAISIFEKHQCAVGPLENVQSMLENPQVVSRNSVITVEDPVLGPVRMANAFPHFTRSVDASLETGPSKVGQNTFETLKKDLNLSDEVLQSWAADGLITGVEEDKVLTSAASKA